MPVPTPKPLNVARTYGTCSTVATGQSGTAYAPFSGRLVTVGCSVGATVATADATCTISVNGVAVSPALAFTVTSGTTIGIGGSGGSNAMVNEGDVISFAFTGSGTAGGPVGLWADVRRGN